MSEPIDPDSALSVAGHVAATAGGGTFLAGILEFFRGRERTKLAERVAALEVATTNLQNQLDTVAPRVLRRARAPKKK